MIEIVLLVLVPVAIALGAVLIIAGLMAAYGSIARKLAHLALTFQGHRHDPLDGFHIADDYPPKPQG